MFVFIILWTIFETVLSVTIKISLVKSVFETLWSINWLRYFVIILIGIISNRIKLPLSHWVLIGLFVDIIVIVRDYLMRWVIWVHIRSILRWKIFSSELLLIILIILILTIIFESLPLTNLSIIYLIVILILRFKLYFSCFSNTFLYMICIPYPFKLLISLIINIVCSLF